MQPPKLVSEILRHVLRVARFDGLSVLLLAGFFALVSAASGDVSGAIFGLLIAAAGAIELHGASLLRAANKRGMSWLVSSQMYLMATVLGYVVFRLANPDVDPMLKLAKSTLAAQAIQAGVDADQFIAEFPTALRILYLAVAFLTILYQGGMAVYYLKRRAAVERAIDEDTHR
jgi:ABC-type antimicrobial peptide transport system permease subunit